MFSEVPVILSMGRGYDVTSCLVPCSFWEYDFTSCLVPYSFLSGRGLPPREGLPPGGVQGLLTSSGGHCSSEMHSCFLIKMYVYMNKCYKHNKHLLFSFCSKLIRM